MNKMKRTITLGLSLLVAAGSFAGCSGKKGSSSDGDITLKYVLPGPGKQPDSDKVWKVMNEKIKEYKGLENVSLDIQVVPASDYSQKFTLWQTSGEKMDIIQTYMLDYVKESRNGTFLKLNDYTKKSEGLKKALPEFMWDYALVDGNYYYVPNYQVLTHVDWSFATPKALSDKYWNAEKAQETICSETTFTDKCWDVIEDYLDKLSAAGKLEMGYYPFDVLSFTIEKGFERVSGKFWMRMDDPEHKVVYLDEVPEKINSFKRVSQLYKKGYIRSDIASAEGSNTDYGQNGGYTLWHEGGRVDPIFKEGTAEQLKKKHDMDIQLILNRDYDPIENYNAAGGTAVSAYSKYPDQAFRVIELINSEEGKDVYNLFAFGIKDEHYKLIGETTVEPIGYVSQADSSSPYGLWKWNTGNCKFAYGLKTEDITGDQIDEVNTAPTVKYPALLGFVADTTEIETEMAQLDTVFEEYKSLNTGNLPDVEKTYAEYMEKLNKAGLEKAREVLQKQVDEFFASKK